MRSGGMRVSGVWPAGFMTTRTQAEDLDHLLLNMKSLALGFVADGFGNFMIIQFGDGTAIPANEKLRAMEIMRLAATDIGV